MKVLRSRGKLDKKYEGPYKVLAVQRPDYVIQRGEDAYKIHGCHLRPWHGSAVVAEREEVDDVQVDDDDVVSDSGMRDERHQWLGDVDDVDDVDDYDAGDDVPDNDGGGDVGDARADPGPHPPVVDAVGGLADPLSFLPQRTRSGRQVYRNPRYV